MENETIFREIYSLISFTEAMQRELFASTFDKLKTIEGEQTFLRLDDIQKWVGDKSASFFQFARVINKKAEKFSESYVEFIKPASREFYTPVGIEIDDV